MFLQHCISKLIKNLLRDRRQLPAFCFKRTMFVWVETPLPSPPNEHIHFIHKEKMLIKKCRYCLHDAVHMVVSSYQKYFRKACDVPGPTEGLFSCFFLSWVGAYLPPFTLRVTDSAGDDARTWRLRVSSAEDVDKFRLGDECLSVSEVCNVMDFFVTETTGKSCKTTRSSPKMLIFLPNEQASTLPPLKRTSFVWNKMPVIGDGPGLQNLKSTYHERLGDLWTSVNQPFSFSKLGESLTEK